MGYRDDFYIPENIIGYTGSPRSCPTVYFKSQFFFGRITQYFSDPENIGRCLICCSNDYYITNYSRVITDPAVLNMLDPVTIKYGNMFEFYNGKVRHTSRAPFVPIKDGNSPLRSHLSLAIYAFPKMKLRSIKECICLYRSCLNDKNYFTSKVKPNYGYKALAELKCEIDKACGGNDMGLKDMEEFLNNTLL